MIDYQTSEVWIVPFHLGYARLCTLKIRGRCATIMVKHSRSGAVTYREFLLDSRDIGILNDLRTEVEAQARKKYKSIRNSAFARNLAERDYIKKAYLYLSAIPEPTELFRDLD